MKAYIVSDLQCHSWSSFGSISAEGINERLLDVIKELRRLRKNAVQEKVKYLFVAGDTFEDRKRLDVVVLAELYNELKEWIKAGIQVIFILGNHDRYPVGDHHSLEVFKDIAIVIDKPRLLRLDNTRVLAVPYLPESYDVLKQLKKYGKKADIVILHTAIKGVKLPSGETWKEGIQLGDLPKSAHVFLGHDHVHKKLRKHVWVIGSLLQVNRSDSGIKKVYGKYDNGHTTFHPTRGPEFIKVQVSSIKEIKVTNYKKHNPFVDNFVYVEWGGSVNKIGKVKRLLLKEYHARAVEIVPFMGVVVQSKTLETPKRIHDLLLQSSQEIPLEDRSTFLELGDEILSEAMMKG